MTEGTREKRLKETWIKQNLSMGEAAVKLLFILTFQVFDLFPFLIF